MRFRKLQIAFSATCLIACVLLVGLWARSFWRWDDFTFNDTVTSLGSNSGFLYWFRSDVPIYSIRSHGWWDFSSGDAYKEANKPESAFKSKPGFQVLSGDSLSLPYWLPIVLIAALAVSPWIPRRFTLRSLLLATTLVAVVLGTIVWFSR
jgi:hypothetical protein